MLVRRELATALDEQGFTGLGWQSIDEYPEILDAARRGIGFRSAAREGGPVVTLSEYIDDLAYDIAFWMSAFQNPTIRPRSWARSASRCR